MSHLQQPVLYHTSFGKCKFDGRDGRPSSVEEVTVVEEETEGHGSLHIPPSPAPTLISRAASEINAQKDLDAHRGQC